MYSAEINIDEKQGHARFTITQRQAALRAKFDVSSQTSVVNKLDEFSARRERLVGADI